MTPLCQVKKLDGRRFVRAFAVLMIGVPAVAQQAIVSAPLSADEVMGRVAQMNAVRAKALESYSSVRSYHLECHCVSDKKADMVVRTDYQAPNKKEFTILSESGSGTVRDRVFKKLLEAEQESMKYENQQRSAITSENYTFQVSYYEKTDTDEFYVLDTQPRSKNKFLFRGHTWVNAKDFAITRVEGEPAVNPSWWTVKTDFKRSYQKIGDFWLPESNESKTKVRVFGTAVLSIDYRDYQIKWDGGRTVASPPSEASAATVSTRATQTQPKFASSAPLFYDVPCVSKSWHKRGAMRYAGRMSSTPHSSASHQSSAVLEEVARTIGVEVSMDLTRSTRSLQLPSTRESSVTITVFSRAELSKSTAALMLRAHCITSPCASMSCATVASGFLLDTKITVPACL